LQHYLGIILLVSIHKRHLSASGGVLARFQFSTYRTMPVEDPVMYSGRLKTRSGLARNQKLPFMGGQ